MKHICVSMNLNEKVLNSYLIRVFKGSLVHKKTCLTAYIPEINVKWPINLFKSFCYYTLDSKEPFRVYKAKITTKPSPTEGLPVRVTQQPGGLSEAKQ